MCCGANLTLQGSNSGNENTYDLDNATTRWNIPDGQLYGKMWCIVFKCFPISLSFEVLIVQAFNWSARWQVVVFYSGDWEEDSLNAIMAFSSLAADFRWDLFLFLFWRVSELCFRQAGCCIYGCSTDGIASHHAWTRLSLIALENITYHHIQGILSFLLFLDTVSYQWA